MSAAGREQRVMVVSPARRDLDLTCSVLADAGILAVGHTDLLAACHELVHGGAALVVADEALDVAGEACVRAFLDGQPSWSDVPIIVLQAPSRPMLAAARAHHAFEVLGNVTIIERPLRITTLVAAVRAALRARARQYDARETLDKLRERERELATANARKDEFLAMLAHELRNPMAAITSALDVIEMVEGTASPVTRPRGIAQRQIKNLVRLVDDLLDVSRITRGAFELRKEPLDLAALVGQATMLAQPSFEARGLELTLEIAPGEYALSGDPTRLEQVVANLLTNAAKYTPSGGSTRVSLGAEMRGGVACAVLHVRDSGRGIEASALPSIFDLFYQAEPGLDRRLGGLGLGLTLVKRLVEMHGGQVGVHSDGPGRGSDFCVELPLSAAVPRGLAAEPADAAPRLRILVIDDAPDVLETMKEALEICGHEVLTAGTGLDGVTTLLEKRPDVALVDIGLPGVSGYDVARMVRGDARGRATKLVAVTGYGGAEVKARTKLAGFDLHLVKPVDLDHLVQVLGQLAA
jgi:signal transduction histidine kinase